MKIFPHENQQLKLLDKIIFIVRDLLEISRGEWGGIRGVIFSQLLKRARSEKNRPDLSIYLIQI